MKTKTKKIVLALTGLIVLLLALSSCAKTPYSYDLDSYIKLPSDWENVSVTEEEVQTRMDSVIEAALRNVATKHILSGDVAQKGDILEISYKLMVKDDPNGYVAYDELSDSACVLEIGKYKYPAELENALIGRAANDSFEIEMRLDGNFSYAPLRGKNVKFVCTVVSVSRYEALSLNDETVKLISSYDTVSEYREQIYTDVKKSICFEKILNKVNVIKYPEKELEKYTADYANYYTSIAGEKQMTLEQYVNKKFYLEMKDFYAEAELYVKDLVKREMLVYKIARDNDITISDEEYDAGAYQYALEYGLDSVKKLEGRFGKDIIEQTLLIDKVESFILSRVLG